MAPRTAVRRERDNDFSAVGKIGRRTGITLPPRPIDENGLEEISGMFSSPRKPSPLRKSFHAREVENESSTLDESVVMVGMDSAGLTPPQVLSTRKSLRGAGLRPPRSASPKKSGINGIARRSNGVDVLARTKEMPSHDPEDRENSPTLSPSRLQQQSMRRFSPSSEKSPLRDITTTGVASTRKAGSDRRSGNEKAHGTPTSASRRSDNLENLYEHPLREAGEAANSTPLPRDDYKNFAANGDDEPEMLNEDDLELPEPVLEDDEEVDQTFEPVSDMVIEENGPTKANSRKKRKSDTMDREPLASSPTAKKARTIVEKKNNTKADAASLSSLQVEPSRQPPKATVSNKRGRPLASGKGKSSAPVMSEEQQAELDQIVERVKARPGQSKSLYILRRETPADDGATHTRSGRISVKPLAYWRNEKCVYGGSPSGSGLQDGARFPMNSIKEIIRTEEAETGMGKQKSRKKGRKGKSKANRSRDSDSEENEGEDPQAEPWESAVGIFRGPAAVWDSQHQTPLDEEEEIEIAYAPASIELRDVPGSSFQYAKLLSTPFFASGIVELPPGGVKRPKNSRKMHMSFFVVKGRVTVQTGPPNGEENRFSIGKGGFWQVPRGNQYSIENELKKPARIFFSQGCEVMHQD